MSSDNTPITINEIFNNINNMGFSELLLYKRYTDEHMILFSRYDKPGQQSKYISSLLAEKNKSEWHNVFNMFSFVLVSVGTLMENGNTNFLFYTVLNNVLIDYFRAISLFDKKGVPDDCWNYLDMVNKKMRELMT